MTHIWIPNQKVFCPLCEQAFKEVKFLTPDGKTIKGVICKTCKIFTFTFDMMFNKWRDNNKKIPCPECQTPMKWFGRMIDCYMKSFCPNCGLEVTKDSTMSLNKDGSAETEDMEEKIPEIINLNIPIDKLKLPIDKKNILKRKLTERRKQP